MKGLLNIGTIIGGIGAVAGVVLGSPIIIAAGVLVALGGVAFGAMSQAQSRSGPHPSELSAEGRMILRPLRQIHDSLAEIVRNNSDVPEIKVVGEEALLESTGIMLHATELIQRRAQFKKSLRGRSEAQLALNRLQRDLQAATSDAERAALQSAIAATEDQIHEYARLDNAVSTVGARIKEAEATLATMKAQMVASLATAQYDEVERSELDSMVQRLRDLNRSLDEAQTMNEVQQ